MDWSNEEYVKVYKRETDDDLLLSWEALALWRAMLLKFDRSGILETRRGRRGLAALVRIPPEVVDRALPELLEDGRVAEIPTGFFARNFIAAQEASKSDKQRQREHRLRRATQARDSGVVANTDVTTCDQTSRAVTSGHTASQVVTLSSTNPIQSEPLHVVTADSLSGQAPAPPELKQRSPEPDRSRSAPDPKVKINTDAWTYAGEVHAKLRADGIDRFAIGWSAWPSGGAMHDLAERTREVIESGADPAVVHRRRIDVAAAESRRAGHLKWFTPKRIYDRDSFWRAAELSPEQVRRDTRTQSEPTLVFDAGDPDLETA